VSHQDQASYSKLINNDLRKCDFNIRGPPLSECQKYLLLEAMVEEEKIWLLQEAIDHGNMGHVKALFTMINSPPLYITYA
jgi:hypothetical protein